MTLLRDYALIGNCETAALVGPQGEIDWLCLPAFDSPSIFAALLDQEKGGRFALSPISPSRVERRYRQDSAILETRFFTPQGVVRLTDFFVIARARHARFYDFTTLHPTCKLVRLVEAEGESGTAMRLRVSARPSYARKAAAWQRRDDGGYMIEEATFFCNVPIEASGDDLLGEFQVTPAAPVYAVLDYSARAIWPDLAAIRAWLRVTTAFWREWNLFNYYHGPHQDLVRRSAVTLKLLTYAATGGFVAAPTMSLPEKPGGHLNWDYRYTWLRDTALFIQTLFGLGYSGEARAFLDFTVKKWMEGRQQESSPEGASLEVLYPIGSTAVPPEESLKHLAGYAGSQPVRVGNAAQDQFQLDNYGHILQSLYFFKHTGGEIDSAKRRMLLQLVDEAVRFWRLADNGIWEERRKSHFTYGKIMCWVGLERAREILGDDDGALEKVCAEIRREVFTRGLVILEGSAPILSEMMDEASVGASSLLAFTSGFLPASVAGPTRAAIEGKLARGPLLYRTEGKPGNEGAFLVCSFWWINHLIREGQLTRAEEILEQLLAFVSPLGLLPEEIAPENGEFLGNFPQAFSHLGLIQSVLTLEKAKKKRDYHGLADHEKFKCSVGPTIGLKGVVAGFLRVPRTGLLFFSRASKWRGR